MDTDIRIQDDLFGHVNGAWLETAEIPDDRAAWGPFVMLADTAEEHVRRDHRGQRQHRERRRRAARSATCSPASWTRTGSRSSATPRSCPSSRRSRRSVTAPSWGRSSAYFERRGGGGLFGSYVDSDDRNSERYIVNLLQGGIGLPDESYYREEKFAEIREKYVSYLVRILTFAERPDPEDTAARVLALETRLAKGHWERAETRDVLKAYNLTTLGDLRATVPSFDFDAWVTALGGSEETIAEMVVRQPSYFAHLETVLADTPIEDWRAFLTVRAIRTAAAYLSRQFVEANFDFYGRTLAGTPELRARWKRGVGLVEGALGEAVGREYVARHFPPRSKELMDELVANLLEAYRRSITDLDWMSEETKQRAFDEAGHVPPEDRLPREVPRLLRARDQPGRPARQRAGRDGVRDRPRAAQDRLAGRPRRVVHAAPDRERLLQPRHQRDLLPGRHPAEAVLRRRRGPGRELRRHRRGDRPRDRPRLRRPGRPVRRSRATSTTGGPRRTRRRSRSSPRRSSSSTTGTSRASCPASTSTARSRSARTSATSAA